MQKLRATSGNGASAGRGFTLIEMMTAIALLILVIVAVGIIFQSATRSVSLSQVVLETMSNTRAVQSQTERDIAGIDRAGFIVIRGRKDATTGRRYDQIAFIANGTFPNRTGSTNSSPFTDRTVANAALVWYGQLVIEPADGTADQSTGVPIGDLPSGSLDKEFVLGRHATLLMSSDGGGTNNRVSFGGIVVPTYATVDVNAVIPAANMPLSEPAAHITSSRIATSEVTSGQLMRTIANAVQGAGGRSAAGRLEADNYCFRFKVLPNPYATEVQVSGVPAFYNSYFRMHPIMLPGVPSFAVEWTDGTTYQAGDVVDGGSLPGGDPLIGTSRWYGVDNPKFGAPGSNNAEPALANNDDYTAIFSFDNRPAWPKALRFRYRVTDPNDRLNGGRDFTQIIKLPD